MAKRSIAEASLALFGCTVMATAVQAGSVAIAPPPMGTGSGVTGIAVQHPIGQSFTANGDILHTVDLQLLNLNMSFELSQDHFVTLDLYDGFGFGGQQLASKTVDVDELLGQLVNSQAEVPFALGAVPVTRGQIYSFQLRAATARFGSVWFAGNPYTGGQAILQGQAFSDPDLYFGISAVPEPGNWALLAAGLAVFHRLLGHRRWHDRDRRSAGHRTDGRIIYSSPADTLVSFSYDSAVGLISRSTDNTSLSISDGWRRGSLTQAAPPTGGDRQP